MSGKVYLVGAGCGAYDLITLRGAEILRRCDTVVYDSLIDEQLLDLAPEYSEKICVGKRAGKHSEEQENINALLIKKAAEGKTVVRLKGGDPFVFGRGGEEITALQQNDIEYETVPGISSCIAVPQLAGIPVTHRRVSRSFHVITGHRADETLGESFKAYAALDGTLVFLMGLGNLKFIADSLMKNKMPPDTPAAVISNGANAKQKTVRATLENIAEEVAAAGLQPPAVIVVGETAAYDLSPAISLPLRGVSVTVTGTNKLVSKLSATLSKLGADVRALSILRVKVYDDNPDLDKALENISQYGCVVLTSINGAEVFFDRLRRLQIDIRSFAGVRFAAIGSGTASALKERGIFPELVPEKFTAAALGKLLVQELSKGERALILRAQRGSAELTEALDKGGVLYDEVKTYDVVSDGSKADKIIDTDYITFASSSGVQAFYENGYKKSARTKAVCIGEVTAEALKKYGVSEFLQSKIQNVEGIADVILSEKK